MKHSLPLERTGYTGRRATNTRSQFLGIQKYVIRFLTYMRKSTFLQKRVHGGREILEPTTSDTCTADDAIIVKVLVRWAILIGERLADRLLLIMVVPNLKPYNTLLVQFR